MDRGRAAEWILSLVLSVNRAGSAVGDFLEESSGNCRFWLKVVKTFLASLWNDFAEHPFAVLLLAVRGCILSGLATWSGLFMLFVAMIPLDAVFAIFAGLHTPVPSWLRVSSEITGSLIGLAAQVLCQFHVGRGIARRGPGREVASAIALCLLQPMVSSILSNLVQHIPAGLFSYLHPTTHPTMLVIVMWKITYVVAICAGAVSIRFELRGATAA